MREKYESLSLATLKDLAKARGLKGVSALRKPELIERMLHEDELEGETKKQETVREKPQQSEVEGNGERIPQYNRTPERTQYHAPAEAVQLDSGERADGILEVLPDGYGFIRCENYLPGENDIYVSPSQIRRFNLKTGDIIKGNIRIKTQGEKFSALLYVTSINGFHPSEGQRRYNFEDMTPIFPNERLVMERAGGTTAMRIVDLISPIGKGQRGMIVSPPKAGKTTLLKDVAKSILRNNRDMHLIILLIDERPEEVTDIREAIQGPNVEVIYSTFDELPESYIIFITEHDVLKGGKPLYTVNRTISELDHAIFTDGSHIIYVNGEARTETALGELMQDFFCKDPHKMNYELLSRRTEYFKESKEGVDTMCKLMEDYADKRARKAAEIAANEKSISIALKLWNNGIRDLQQIAELTDLPLEMVKELFKDKIA